jgi:archaellum biogenesis protein FlaJ (TadC family)
VLAYDYPLLGVFWTIVLFSFAFLIIFTIIWAFIDNFRRRDHGGWAKALWAIFILFLPLLGVFVYLLARPADPDAFEGPAQVR